MKTSRAEQGLSRRDFLKQGLLVTTGGLVVPAVFGTKAAAELSQTLSYRVIRDTDLLNVEFNFVNFRVFKTDGIPKLLQPLGSSLVVMRFPPQNLAEAIFDERHNMPLVYENDPIGVKGSATVNGPERDDDEVKFAQSPIASAMSGPSWLAFEVPQGEKPFEFSVNKWLRRLQDLNLNVARAARRPGPLPEGLVPELPTENETVLEIPYRLYLSPGPKTRVQMSGLGQDPSPRLQLKPLPNAEPVDPEQAVTSTHELWHAALFSRTPVVPSKPPEGLEHAPEELRPPRHVVLDVKAIYSPDYKGPLKEPSSSEFYPFAQADFSLHSLTRHCLVRQMAEEGGKVDVEHLMLSALGANASLYYADQKPVEDLIREQLGLSDGKATRVSNKKLPARGLNRTQLRLWKHRIVIGRDVFIAEAFFGFLMPFDFPAVYVEVTRRKFGSKLGDKVAGEFMDDKKLGAFLLKVRYILPTNPTKYYTDFENPFKRGNFLRRATLRTVQSPNLSKPVDVREKDKIEQKPGFFFWPKKSEFNPASAGTLPDGVKPDDVNWEVEVEDTEGNMTVSSNAQLFFASHIGIGHGLYQDFSERERTISFPMSKLAFVKERPEIQVDLEATMERLVPEKAFNALKDIAKNATTAAEHPAASVAEAFTRISAVVGIEVEAKLFSSMLDEIKERTAPDDVARFKERVQDLNRQIKALVPSNDPLFNDPAFDKMSFSKIAVPVGVSMPVTWRRPANMAPAIAALDRAIVAARAKAATVTTSALERYNAFNVALKNEAEKESRAFGGELDNWRTAYNTFALKAGELRGESEDFAAQIHRLVRRAATQLLDGNNHATLAEQVGIVSELPRDLGRLLDETRRRLSTLKFGSPAEIIAAYKLALKPLGNTQLLQNFDALAARVDSELNRFDAVLWEVSRQLNETALPGTILNLLPFSKISRNPKEFKIEIPDPAEVNTLLKTMGEALDKIDVKDLLKDGDKDRNPEAVIAKLKAEFEKIAVYPTETFKKLSDAYRAQFNKVKDEVLGRLNLIESGSEDFLAAARDEVEGINVAFSGIREALQKALADLKFETVSNEPRTPAEIDKERLKKAREAIAAALNFGQESMRILIEERYKGAINDFKRNFEPIVSAARSSEAQLKGILREAGEQLRNVEKLQGDAITIVRAELSNAVKTFAGWQVPNDLRVASGVIGAGLQHALEAANGASTEAKLTQLKVELENFIQSKSDEVTRESDELVRLAQKQAVSMLDVLHTAAQKSVKRFDEQVEELAHQLRAAEKMASTLETKTLTFGRRFLEAEGGSAKRAIGKAIAHLNEKNALPTDAELKKFVDDAVAIAGKKLNDVDDKLVNLREELDAMRAFAEGVEGDVTKKVTEFNKRLSNYFTEHADGLQHAKDVGSRFFHPQIQQASVVIPALKDAANSAPVRSIKMMGEYLSGGFKQAQNGAFAKLTEVIGPAAAVGDKIRTGIAKPAATIAGLSREVGAVVGSGPDALKNIAKKGEAALKSIEEDIRKSMDGAKLFGAVPLAPILGPLLRTRLPKICTLEIPEKIERTWDWTTTLKDFPNGICSFLIHDERTRLRIFSRATINLPKPEALVKNPKLTSSFSGSIDGYIGAWDESAKRELEPKDNYAFAINLLDLIEARFKLVRFHAAAGSDGGFGGAQFKPQVSAVKFLGPLQFVENIQSLLAGFGLGGFRFKLTPDFVSAGFSLELPAITSGAFNLCGLRFEASLKISFTGAPMRFSLGISSFEEPFMMTVGPFGGRGFLAVEIGTDGYRALKGALEFGGAFQFDIGVASGGVHVVAGFYFEIGTDGTTLTGYFRAGGNLNVLGLIHITLEFFLGMKYHKSGNQTQMSGVCEITVSIDMCFFSIDVSVRMEKQMAGSGGDGGGTGGLISDSRTRLAGEGRPEIQQKVYLSRYIDPTNGRFTLDKVDQNKFRETVCRTHWYDDYWNYFDFESTPIPQQADPVGPPASR